MSPRRYAVLDVFTDTALAGNPLAVVLDGEGLDDDRMQAIAGEFNLSETVFVQGPDNPAHSAKVRIFTPARELPFAGHPTVGTAILLAHERFGAVETEQDAMIVLEEAIGDVRCGVRLMPDEASFAEFDVPQQAQMVAEAHRKDQIAAALSLAPTEVGFENHVPSVYSAGVPFTFVPVHDLDAIARAQSNPEMWAQGFGDTDHNAAFIYCRQTIHTDSAFHARMFAPKMGIREDPATGGAVAAFAGVVHQFDQPPSGMHRYRIEQGYEMGRPSHIGLEIECAEGGLKATRISGQAVIVAQGVLSI